MSPDRGAPDGGLFDLSELDDPEALEARFTRESRTSAGIPAAEPPVARDSAKPRAGEGARISAVEIAERLGLPRPTPQQQAVIEAPLAPRIVVAGAGSGKTETMANRVVWLVANGLVGVSEILGLTFTRKAAGELAERIRIRLAELAATGLRAEPADPFDAPAIATYNAFANGIFREYAVVIGRESEASVLSEASAWQLARRVVVSSSDERLLRVDKSLDVVTTAVLGLSRALSENVVAAPAVARYAREFEALAGLPKTEKKAAPGVFAYLEKAIAPVAPLPLLLDLAEAYAAEKIRRGSVEFSDQIALALAIVEGTPRVVADYRERFRVVLLDEYQDTSVVQTRLLAALFRGRPVMAVGDPHQSIYGWRGASAANLARFDRDFAAPRRSQGESAPDAAAVPFALSTSWRNPRVVLDAANTLVAPLAAESGIAVERLGPRPGVAEGRLDVSFDETVRDEARRVAAWFAARLRPAGADPAGRAPATAAAPSAESTPPPSAALLCRSVKKIEPFTSALDELGIPYHVLGIGGLLAEPAVADLVSTLRVLYFPTAGPDLLRLLAGARWRLGAKDLVALRTLASWIAERDHRFQRLADEVAGRIRGSVDADEDRSIIDALDFVATADAAHRALAGFSAEGIDRLRRLALELAELRTRAGLGLVDYVDLVQQTLRLDVEALASPHAREHRAALDAFAEQLTGFLALDPAAGLGEFLAWLEEAEKRDRLEPRTEEPEPGTVQILTIHGAKGLEWDVVAVPRMVDGELPADPRSSLGWLSFGELPYDFRGDRAELPALEWRGLETQSEFKPALDRFKGEVAGQLFAEQRRLIYVAVTRARHELLLSGSFWTTGVKGARGPSVYLRELERAGLIAEGVLPEAPEHEENPLAETESWAEWPRDPLGRRRSRVAAAAEAVAEAAGRLQPTPTPWDDEITLLLAERAAQHGERPLEAPVRIPASRFKDYVADPAAVVRALQRPMPERPYRQTRLGTRFHSWVEERFRRGGAAALGGLGGELGGLGGDLLDAFDDELEPLDDELEPLVGEGDLPTGGGGAAQDETAPVAPAPAAPVRESAEAVEQRRLDELIARFEASPFADRMPVEVEVEIHLVLGGRVIVCKIDAVFAEGDRFEVVDWKTGKAPRDAADLELKQLQLALYRLAYARWAGIPLERIDAAFYFVADDAVIRPARLYDADELEQLLAASAL